MKKPKKPTELLPFQEHILKTVMDGKQVIVTGGSKLGKSFVANMVARVELFKKLLAEGKIAIPKDGSPFDTFKASLARIDAELIQSKRTLTMDDCCQFCAMKQFDALTEKGFKLNLITATYEKAPATITVRPKRRRNRA